MLCIHVPPRGAITLEHLVVDLNGTLTVHGEIVQGVAERLSRLTKNLDIRLVTADTRGTARDVSRRLGISFEPLPGNIPEAEGKLQVVQALGPDETVAIGNGNNDTLMLGAAALALVVVQSEGAAISAIKQADVVFTSICDALDCLVDSTATVATLRG